MQARMSSEATERTGRWLGIETEEMLPEVVEELPIPVVSGERLATVNEASSVIDRHLDFESKLQGTDMSPDGLCVSQKVSLVADVAHLVG